MIVPYRGLVNVVLLLQFIMFYFFIIPLSWIPDMREFFHCPATDALYRKVQFAVDLTVVLACVLCYDGMLRVPAVSQDGETMRSDQGMQAAQTESRRERWAEFNVYLAVMALVMGIILSKTCSTIAELVRRYEKLVSRFKKLCSEYEQLVTAKQISSSVSAASGGEAEKLKVQLADLEKQLEQQQQECKRLADELAAAKGEKGSGKSDLRDAA